MGVLIQQHRHGLGLQMDVDHFGIRSVLGIRGIGGHGQLGQQQGQQQKNGAKTAEFHNDFFSICAIMR